MFKSALVRLVFMPVLLFAAAALSGAVCRNGEYRQAVTSRRGDIDIAIVSDDNPCPTDAWDLDTAMCLPLFYFSPPVAKVRIGTENQTVLTAACPNGNDCMDELSCLQCAPSASFFDGGISESSMDASSDFCSAESFLYAFIDKMECNNVFTVTVETKNGLTGSVTFMNYFEYNNSDWGG